MSNKTFYTVEALILFFVTLGFILFFPLETANTAIQTYAFTMLAAEAFVLGQIFFGAGKSQAEHSLGAAFFMTLVFSIFNIVGICMTGAAIYNFYLLIGAVICFVFAIVFKVLGK